MGCDCLSRQPVLLIRLTGVTEEHRVAVWLDWDMESSRTDPGIFRPVNAYWGPCKE